MNIEHVSIIIWYDSEFYVSLFLPDCLISYILGNSILLILTHIFFYLWYREIMYLQIDYPVLASNGT